MDSRTWIVLAVGVVGIASALWVIKDSVKKNKDEKKENKKNDGLSTFKGEDVEEKKEEKVCSSEKISLTESTLNFSESKCEERSSFASVNLETSKEEKLTFTESNLNFSDPKEDDIEIVSIDEIPIESIAFQEENNENIEKL